MSGHERTRARSLILCGHPGSPIRRIVTFVAAVAAMLTARPVAAQPLGTFRWQLQPYCDVVTVDVTQQGALYRMDGFDDQCGAAQRAPIVGVATPNTDGTIGFGLTIVTVPGGRNMHVDARITLAALSGPWSDSAGNTRTFARALLHRRVCHRCATCLAGPNDSNVSLGPGTGNITTGISNTNPTASSE